jgi:hypothetical protein
VSGVPVPDGGRPERAADPGRGAGPDRAPGAPGSGAPSGAVRDTTGEPEQPGGARARRFWSGRRLPSALTAAVVLGLSGVFLYDIAAVRTGRRAMSWRSTLADELATRPLDDTWIVLGASVAAVLGLWLLVLALTPGERGVLPMTRRGPAGVRAGLDRRAAELILRDRMMEVPGIRWARVRVGRRRVRARAASHFRDLEEVRGDVEGALDEAVRQMGLARAPRPTIRLQRADKKA